MKSCCLVVIGHVDHGKTTLVHALTAVRTDRLPEEKARGLSIIPGYAYRNYEQGTVDFVDAPGHEDFIQAMVAGASGAQAVLLVVSATDGIQAQTHEHLAIAQQLGITRAVIAVTKAELACPADLQSCIAELAATLAGTPFSDAPITICSAHSGQGISDLEVSLQNLLTNIPEPAGPRMPMLPIDRVFSVAGRGTIITGTLLGGDLSADMEVILHPKGQRATLRGLQCRGVARSRVASGTRVAVNLRGIAVDDIARGDVLCAAGQGAASMCMDVLLTPLPEVLKPIKHMEKVRVLLGTSHEVATVHLLARPQAGLAQLRFARAVCGYEGQRAILRRLSPPETIAGAEILDTHATATRAGDKVRQTLLDAITTRSPAEIAHSLCQRDGGTASLVEVARLSRQAEAEVRDNLRTSFVDVALTSAAPRQIIKGAKQAVIDALEDYHRRYPLHPRAQHAVTALHDVSPILMTYVLEALQREDQIHVHPAGLALSGHNPLSHLTLPQQNRMDEIEARISHHCMTNPPLLEGGADPDLLVLLLDTGRVITLHNIALKQTLLFHRDSLMAAAEQLRIAFPPPQDFTTSQARTTLATTRKVIVPVLEYFDKCGLAVRIDDIRQMTDVIPVPPSAASC